MKIILVKPSMGEIIKGYDINEGSMEPLQLAILASLAKDDDEVKLYDDRIENVPFDEKADFVAITVDSFNARRAYEIATEFRKRETIVILGGVHPTLLPDEAEMYADAIVVGDAEPVWNELISDIKSKKLKKRYQAPFGIPQAGLFPRRDIFKGKKYLPFSLVQYSRGCKYNCSFCSVSSFFKNSYQCRSINDVLYEIEKDKLKNILFVDDNLVTEKKNLKILLKELIPMKIHWASQSSIDMVKDLEMLDLMAQSGCVGHLVGFESINVNTLKWFNKSANLKDFNNYKEALQIFCDFGFLTWASFMIGNDFDDLETIEKTVEFAIKSKFTLAFFHVLQPYPATKIYEQFKAEGRLLYDAHWWNHPDFKYNSATFIPKKITPEELANAAVKANKDFYTWSSIGKRMLDTKTNMRNLINFSVYTRFNYILKKTST
ncbi:MAG: B12-binding domain-containing radical SAM protein [Bacteroidales bacterium]|nr:B12-binding domain-containing radical SAM protein [Bacteroidales bacterium]